MQRRAAGAFLNLASAHIGGERLVDLGLQRLGLRLAGDSADDGLAHDIAAAVDHIGGGIPKNISCGVSSGTRLRDWIT